MKLNEIVKQRQIKVEAKRGLIEEYTKNIKDLDKQIKTLTEKEALLLNDMNLDKVTIAEEILTCEGDVTIICGGEVLTELASIDISNGCPRLKKHYFGNKEYSGFHQRCDCEYFFGPKHGGISERIQLNVEYRGKDLTDDQKDACIYYLKNYKRIQSLRQTAKYAD